MSRNRDLDESIKAERKLIAMNSAFRLFSEKGIDRVTMPEIAADSGVARQSLFRYFSNKTELVIAIGAWKWKEYISANNAKLPKEEIDKMTAAEYLRWYMDSFLDLYREHRDILRFNYYFNSFVQGERATEEQMKPYTEVVEQLIADFHVLYEKGMRDGTINGDIPEEVMISSSFHIMLAAVTRYSIGLLYRDGNNERELTLLKNALLQQFIKE